MKYAYQCARHGEVELDHRITEDRKKQYCPRLVRSKAGKGKTLPCGAHLKPLIVMGTHNRDWPAVFKGYHWPRQESLQYRNIGCNEKGPNGEPYRHRDPIAVN